MKRTTKRILLLSIFISHLGFAQTNTIELEFNKRYYDAVDHWIAFPKEEKDSSYMLGFIYIDQQAGFTFDYNGRFKIIGEGLQKVSESLEASIKSRLSPNTVDVAILSDDQVKQLELPKEPDWLKIYKQDSGKVEYLKNIGFHYNAVGASNLALDLLEKAYEQEPHHDGLEFELAYAYNALGQFNSSIPVLEKAIQNEAKNFWFYRELGFAYKNLGQMTKAEEAYFTGIKLTKDKAQKAEMAVNMAQAYFNLRNKEGFKEWAKLTRKFTEKDSKFSQYISYWKGELNKE